ncbi:protein nuclear fusion defective 4, partial [Fagus crenata]
VLKGYSGLSGAVITQMYHAIYGDDAKSLILLIAWLPVVLCLVFLRTMRIMKAPRQPNEVKLFYSFLYIALCLAGYLMVIIIVEKRVNFTQSEYGVSAAMVLFLLFLPLAVVIMGEFKLWKSKKEARNDPSPLKVTTLEATSYETSTISVLTEPSAQNKPISCWKTSFQPPDRGEDYTILQALFSIDMLLIFFATICGLGGTLTAIDNLGITSEIFITKYKIPRPLMLTLILPVSCVGHLLIAFNVPNAVASPIGSYLLNMRVAGHLYDKEAEKQLAALGLTRKAGKDLNCSGVECFKLSFIIITAMTLLGTLVSLILALRTRKFYKSDIYKKFREDENVAQNKTAIAGNGAQGN